MKRTIPLIFVGLTITTLLVFAPLLVRAATTSPAAAAPEALQTAEQLYRQGDYALAAASYRQLVDQGAADSGLFYNMGLAYRQAGELGQALWSLRSAESLDPRDPETRLALDAGARPTGWQRRRRRRRLPAAESLPGRLAALTNPWLTADELAWLALSLWIVVAMLLLLPLADGR